MNADEIFGLAAECGVPMHAACKRSGVSDSTPFRWQKKGQTPDSSTAAKLRAAILVVALERGTLPGEYEAEAIQHQANEVDKIREPAEIIKELKGGVRELERALRL